MVALASTVVASIVPFDPAVGITAVASVALFLAVVFMSFLALAPVVSKGWEQRLDAAQSTARAEPNEAD